MITEELRDYIRQCRALAIPEEVMRSELAQNGWIEEDISKALMERREGTSVTAPLPPPAVSVPTYAYHPSTHDAFTEKILTASLAGIHRVTPLYDASGKVMTNETSSAEKILRIPGFKEILVALSVFAFLAVLVLVVYFFSSDRQ